jgi:hypothetical protein
MIVTKKRLITTESYEVHVIDEGYLVRDITAKRNHVLPVESGIGAFIAKMCLTIDFEIKSFLEAPK